METLTFSTITSAITTNGGGAGANVATRTGAAGGSGGGSGGHIQQELDQQEVDQEILPLQTHHKVMLVVQVLRMVVVKKQVTDKVVAVAVQELRVETTSTSTAGGVGGEMEVTR